MIKFRMYRSSNDNDTNGIFLEFDDEDSMKRYISEYWSNRSFLSINPKNIVVEDRVSYEDEVRCNVRKVYNRGTYSDGSKMNTLLGYIVLE